MMFYQLFVFSQFLFLFLFIYFHCKVVDNSTNGTGVFIANSANLRYDLYEGEITTNDIYTICPFKDKFYYIPDVSGKILQMFLGNLTLSSPGKNLDRFPYRRETLDVPHFYYSSVTTEYDQYYDIICESYDVPTLQRIFDKIGENEFIPYPTTLDSTSALYAYVYVEMLCSK